MQVKFRQSALKLKSVGDTQLSRQVFLAFRLWQRQLLYKHLLVNGASAIEKANLKRVKAGLSFIQQKFNPLSLLRGRFLHWKSIVVVAKSTKRLPSSLGPNQLRSSLIEKYGAVMDNSNNISFIDHKVHSKMTSFMKISKHLMQNYVAQGTLLQKYIDTLKLLAQQQSASRRKLANTGGGVFGQKASYS